MVMVTSSAKIAVRYRANSMVGNIHCFSIETLKDQLIPEAR
jgi:hypothetical protein